MYICSILPENGFQKSHKIDSLIETTASWNWNASILGENYTIDDEWILTFRDINSNVLGTLNTTSLRPLYGDVMSLLHSWLIFPKFVFYKRVSLETLEYIRLYTKEDAPTDNTSVKYIKNEISLLRALKRAFIENTQISNKKVKCYDLAASSKVFITPTNSICLLDLQTNSSGHILKVKAFPVIVAHKSANRVHACMNLASNNVTRNWSVLIITSETQYWFTKCQTSYATKIIESQISESDLATYNVFILPKTAIEQQLAATKAATVAFSDMLHLVLGGIKPSNEQTLRFMTGSFCKSFPNSSKPLTLHTWSTIIYDDMKPIKDFTAENTIVTQVCSKMKMESLSLHEIGNIFNIHLTEASILYSQLIRCIQHIEIPKALLRKVKFHTIPIKYTIAEARLHSIQSSLQTHMNRIPYDLRHSLKRLSQNVWSIQILKELIEDIFDTSKESFAKLLVPNTAFTSQKEHVLAALENHHADCCVCFDKCNEQRTLTLCGHSYCKDCSVQVFQSLRDPVATVDCPYCRMKVNIGDLFTVQETGGTNKMPLLAKETVIELLSKATPQVIIDQLGDIGSPTELFMVPPNVSKINILLVSVKHVEKLANWLLSMTTEHTVRVTILDGPKDHAWSKDLLECFKS